MAIIKEKTTNAGKDVGGKRNTYTLLVVLLISAGTMKIRMEFSSKKTKNRTFSSYSTPGCVPKGI
jgi:hypothetical protein